MKASETTAMPTRSVVRETIWDALCPGIRETEDDIVHYNQAADAILALFSRSSVKDAAPAPVLTVDQQKAIEELEEHCSYTDSSPTHDGEVIVCGVCESTEHKPSCPFSRLTATQPEEKV